MGWLIAGGLLILLLVLPVGVLAFYDSMGLRVLVSIGFLRIPVYPAGKKAEKPPKKAKAGSAEESFEKTKTATKSGGSLKDFLPLLSNILEFLADFRRKLRVNDLRLKLTLAGDDPADLAINYGRAWTALGNLMPRLDQLFRIKKRDVEVQCDFTAEQTLVDAKLHITITVGRLLWMALFHGMGILKKFLAIMNQRKGGADKA